MNEITMACCGSTMLTPQDTSKLSVTELSITYCSKCQTVNILLEGGSTRVATEEDLEEIGVERVMEVAAHQKEISDATKEALSSKLDEMIEQLENIQEEEESVFRKYYKPSNKHKEVEMVEKIAKIAPDKAKRAFTSQIADDLDEDLVRVLSKIEYTAGLLLAPSAPHDDPDMIGDAYALTRLMDCICERYPSAAIMAIIPDKLADIDGVQVKTERYHSEDEIPA